MLSSPPLVLFFLLSLLLLSLSLSAVCAEMLEIAPPSPSPAPTQRSHSLVHLNVSFSLSDALSERLSEKDIPLMRTEAERFVCGALSVESENCLCGGDCFSFSSSSPHNTSILQRWWVTARVSVTLRAVDFASLSHNEINIVAFAERALALENLLLTFVWESYYATAVLPFTAIYFSPSTQLMHTSVMVAGITSPPPPPRNNVPMSSFSPVPSPSPTLLRSFDGRHNHEALSSKLVMLVSVLSVVACVQMTIVYVCFLHKNNKVEEAQPEPPLDV